MDFLIKWLKSLCKSRATPAQQLKQQNKQQKKAQKMQQMESLRIPDNIFSHEKSDQIELTEKGQNLHLVFFVRTDLKMSNGKIAAQVGHAILGVHRSYVKQMQNNKKKSLNTIIQDNQQIYKTEQDLSSIWEKQGKHTLIYKCPNQNILESIRKQGDKEGYVTHVVRDAGRTQIARGSLTVCAMGFLDIAAIQRLKQCFTEL